MSGEKASALREDRQSLSRGLALSGLGHLFNVFEPLLTLLLIRLTNASVWGLFLLAESIGYAAARLASLGLDRGLMWESARGREADGYRLRGFPGALCIGACLGLAVAALGHAVLPWLVGEVFGEPEALGAAQLILWTTPVSVVVSLLIFTAQGLRSVSARIAVQQVTVPLLTRGVPLLLLLGGSTLMSAPELIALGHLLGNLAALVVASLLLRRRMADVNARLCSEQRWPSSELMRYSVPTGLAELMSTVMVRVDVWMLALLLDAAAVGLYGVILSLSKALRTLRHVVTPIITPIMTEASECAEPARVQGTFEQSAFLLSCIAAPMLVALWAFAEPLLSLYGPEFVDASWPLIILCAGTLVHVLAGLGGAVVAGAGRGDLLLYNQLLPIALNVGLNLWLIPPLGVLGAAIATATSLGVMSLMELGFARRLVGHPLCRWVALTPLAVSLVTGLCGLTLALSLSLAPESLAFRVVALSAFAACFSAWLLVRGRGLYRRF